MKSKALVIEIFAGCIIAYSENNPEKYVVLQSNAKSGSLDLELPDADIVKRKLFENGIRERKINIILNRNLWLTKFEQHQQMTKKELFYATEIAEQSLKDEFEEGIVSKAESFNSNGQSYIFAVGLSKEITDSLSKWAVECGFYLKIISMSSFHFKCVELGKPLFSIAIYPNGWEVTLSEDEIILDTYSSTDLSANLLGRVLALMSIKYLARDNCDLWTDIPPKIEMTQKTLNAGVYINGNLANYIESGLQEWNLMLTNLGIGMAIEVVKEKPVQSDISWPNMDSLSSKSIKRKYPKLYLNSKRGWQRLPIWTIMVSLCILITGLLFGLNIYTQNNISKITTQLTLTDRSLVDRAERNIQITDLEDKIQFSQQFVEDTLLLFKSLEQLDGILKDNTYFERLSLNDNGIEGTLLSERATEDLIALENSKYYKDITVLTPIVIDEYDLHNRERVSLRFTIADIGVNVNE